MPRKKKRGRPRKRMSNVKIKKKEKKPRLNIHPETKRGIIVIVFFAIAVLFILSFQGVSGVLGEYIFKYSKLIFGSCLWLIPLAFFISGIITFRDIHKNVLLSTLLGILLFVLSFLGLVNILISNGELKAGWLGYLVSWPFMKLIGLWGSLVVFMAALAISVLVAFNIPLRRIKKQEDEEDVIKEKMSKEIKGIGFTPEKTRFGKFTKSILKPKFEMKEMQEEKEEEKQEELLKTTPTILKDYIFPPLDLLEQDKGQPSSGDIKSNLSVIEKTLYNFNIPVEMGEVNVGPTVTQYTLRPASGIKLSKITGLNRDLSLALAAHPIRIEAPIPGRSLVGIELPNKKATLVRLRDLLQDFDYRKNGHHLNLGLGRDVSGHAIFANLVKMPHLLIAGSTGSGKSICIHSLILSLLYQKSPQELKFILIDPKRVELPLYNGIPHLLTPVIVDFNKVNNAFKWAIKEMENRYKILSNAAAKDLASYNEKAKEILPYVVIIVDELADIMVAYGKEVEGAIVRLAQMARAVGIHLILSTQRPSVEVITGLIKANITSRIALQVASQVDSRTILDTAGADKLLGNGDMLFLAGDVGKTKRIQGSFISDKEIKDVVMFLRKQAGDIEYEEDITAAPEKEMHIQGGNVFDDPIYEEAKDLIIKTGKASASYLQRRFRIGYARAASLLDMLEQNGIVGPSEGSKPREVLTGYKRPIESEIIEESFSDLEESSRSGMEEEGVDIEAEEEKLDIPLPPDEEEF
ncbi:MAG: DNA translocase FtsK 4TM domain-containing protein [Patescibacteria group bacterium]